MTLLLTLMLATRLVVASRYGDPGDRWAGGPSLRCHRYLPARTFARAVQRGCAHRTLPCGTVVRLWSPRTRRSTLCQVVDRGPYGALFQGHWRLKRRASDPGEWRGQFDLLPPTADRLGVHGLVPLLQIFP